MIQEIWSKNLKTFSMVWILRKCFITQNKQEILKCLTIQEILDSAIIEDISVNVGSFEVVI